MLLLSSARLSEGKRFSFALGRWSGGAKVLDKFSAPGRPTNLDNSRGFSLSRRRPDIDRNTVSKGR